MNFIDPSTDPWSALPEGTAPRANSLVDVAAWRCLRDTWPQHGASIGLVLDNDLDVEDIAADLPRLSLVVLRFPKWTDGRAYSQARLLRTRYRYGGDVRATGDVLVDMLPLLERCGFSSAQLRGDQKLSSARRALRFFADGYYQADTIGGAPRFAARPAVPPAPLAAG